MDDSSSDTTTLPQQFARSDTTPAPELKVQLKVPRTEYYYFSDKFDLKAVKEAWPCAATGYTKEDQKNLLSNLQQFFKQPHREDGDYVVMTETYSSLRSRNRPKKCAENSRSRHDLENREGQKRSHDHEPS